MLSPADVGQVKALARLDELTLVSGLGSLSPAKRAKFLKLAEEVVSNASKQQRTVARRPPTPKKAVVVDDSKFFNSLADAEASAMQNMAAWAAGRSLIAPDLSTIDNKIIPNKAAGLIISLILLTFLAVHYITSAVSSLRAVQTLAFYNACIVGRRLFQIDSWWKANGRPAKKFSSWIADNLVGTALGEMTPDEIRQYVTLGRLQSHFPNIIFITSMGWRQIARQPEKFFNYITASPHRQKFWSSANTKMQIKLSDNAPTAEGPHILHDAISEVPQIEMDMEPYDQVVAWKTERDAKNASDQFFFAEEQMQLAEDCPDEEPK